MTPPRPPRRIVHEHAVGVGADRDDVVVASGPIFEEQNDRRARGQLFAEKVDGSVERRRAPVPLPYRLDEDVIGDAARAAIDERLELLHVGVAIAVYRNTMATAAPPHNAGVCGRKGTFSVSATRRDVSAVTP